MGEANQGDHAKRFRGGPGRAFEQGFKYLYCSPEISGLEAGKAKIETQARHLRVQAQSLMVENDRVLVMLLPRLQETEMRVRFSVIRLATRERSPLGFGFGDL